MRLAISLIFMVLLSSAYTKYSFSFLEEPDLPSILFENFEMQQIEELQQYNLENLDENHLKDLFKGFWEGFGFFKGLPHEDECKQDDPELDQAWKDLYELIKNFNIKKIKEFIDNFRKIMDVIYHRMEADKERCQAYCAEVKKVCSQMKEYVCNNNYQKLFLLHTIQYSQQIIKNAKAACDTIKSGQYYTGGKMLGELVKFTFLWDFTPK
jgi:hypothetical protein